MNDQIQDFFQKSLIENQIDNALYQTYSVKKGLRNEDGTGVLVGLTKISDVVGYKKIDGQKKDDYGRLYYRGINVEDMIRYPKENKRYLFEEICFLILPSCSYNILFLLYFGQVIIFLHIQLFVIQFVF